MNTVRSIRHTTERDTLGAPDLAQWIERCVLRLRERWPGADGDALQRTASALADEPQWRRYAPEVAVVAWLRIRLPVPLPSAADLALRRAAAH